jgi:hypothetical protein
VIHIVHRHIDEFQTRMLEFEARKEPLNVTWAFPALTGDIIMDYFFGFNYGSTKDPGFSSFHAAFKLVGMTGHIAMQFPWFLPVSFYSIPHHHADILLDNMAWRYNGPNKHDS